MLHRITSIHAFTAIIARNRLIYPTGFNCAYYAIMTKERQNLQRRRWVRRHSVEARLLLTEGWYIGDVAARLGFSRCTLSRRIKRESLRDPLDAEEGWALANELREIKAREAIVTAEAGSIALKRASDELDAAHARKMAVRETPNLELEEDDGAMKSLKQIREMSDDELVAYVESLVPGLETKSCGGLLARANRVSGTISVSAKCAPSAETVGKRRRLAQLAFPRWAWCRQDTRWSRMGALCRRPLWDRADRLGRTNTS